MTVTSAVKIAMMLIVHTTDTRAAFATILAVVAGLVIAASGAIAHDLWANLSGREDEESERKVARIAVDALGDVNLVFEAQAKALKDDPSVAESRVELERLAGEG